MRAGVGGDAADLAADDTGGRRELHLGQLGERRLDTGQGRLRVAAGRPDQVGRQAFLIVQQDLQKVFGRETLMALAQGQALGSLNLELLFLSSCDTPQLHTERRQQSSV